MTPEQLKETNEAIGTFPFEGSQEAKEAWNEASKNYWAIKNKAITEKIQAEAEKRQAILDAIEEKTSDTIEIETIGTGDNVRVTIKNEVLNERMIAACVSEVKRMVDNIIELAEQAPKEKRMFSGKEWDRMKATQLVLADIQHDYLQAAWRNLVSPKVKELMDAVKEKEQSIENEAKAEEAAAGL